MSNREDWCWLAGIFEGEGTAALRFNKGRWATSPRRAYVYAAVSQTNEEMLREVQRIVGYGKIYTTKPKFAHYKMQWTWYVSCRQARQFLNSILPFMRSPHKRDQVICALAEDIKARAEGTKARRDNLRLCSSKRWEAYRHAKIS